MMDYSKRGIEKRQKQIRSSAPKAEKKLNFTIFRVVIICILLVAVVGVSAAVGGIKGVIDSAPDINSDDIAPDAFKSYMYDEGGNELLELVESGANRIEIGIDQMSKDVQNAFVALEDERFWEHNGIDVKGIMRAFAVGIRNFGFSEGASTITQQVLKNSIFSGGNEADLLMKFKRKFQEQYLAIKLEEDVSKEKILQTYLNTINLGETCYGVEAAAQMYFAKSASELNVSESAVLAAIAKSPTEFNPYINPENNAARRTICLDNMLDQGYITQEQHDEALADDVYARINENTVAYKQENYKTTSYYQDAVIDQLIDEIAEYYGYEDDPSTTTVNEARVQGQHKLYSGGFSIYLAQDQGMQKICDDFFADNSNFPTTEYLLQWALTVYNEDGTTTNYSVEMLENKLTEHYGKYNLLYTSEDKAKADIELYKQLEGIPNNETNYETMSLVPQIQGSFVLMDQSTGYVKAIVGGRGTKTESRTFNRATQATRQPGSAFKIVSTYAPALDEYGKTLASTELDSIYEVYGGHKINNVDLRYTNAQTSYRSAIIQSKNTVAARVMDNVVTPEKSLEFLEERFHFSTLVPEDNVTSLALGGITNGVSNLELTTAFAAIANNGVYTKPVLYTYVTDHDGNVIIDHRVSETSVAVKPSTSAMLLDAMQGVVQESGGTASAVNMAPMSVAGKTGTSEERRDLWFVGSTPYYTAGIWFGYDDNTPVRDRTSQFTYQQYLWKKIMVTIHEGLEAKDFEMPESVERVWVCKQSGLLASSRCSGTYSLFDTGEVPTQYCSGDHGTSDISGSGTSGGTTDPSTGGDTTDPGTGGGTVDPGTGGGTVDPGTGGGTVDPGTGGGTVDPGTGGGTVDPGTGGGTVDPGTGGGTVDPGTGGDAPPVTP